MGIKMVCFPMRACLSVLLYFKSLKYKICISFDFRYVAAQKDRVTVIFSTVFKDADDIIIGKVFLQVPYWFMID